MRALALALALGPLTAWGHGDQPQVTDIAFPAAFPGEAWALSDNQGIFAVGEAGARWLCEDAIEPGGGVRAVATLDAARWILSTDTQLWRTDDGGCSFRSLPLPLAGHRARFISPDPDQPGTLVIATDTLGRDNDVFWTEDAGRTWHAAGLAVPGQFTSLVRAPADPRRLYVVHERGTERSDDGGRTWRPFKPGPADLEATPLEFSLLATSPVDADVVMAVVERFDSIVLRSPDGGETWETVAEVPDFPLQLTFDRTGRRPSSTASSVGFLRSEDGGAHFQATPDRWSASAACAAIRAAPASGVHAGVLRRAVGSRASATTSASASSRRWRATKTPRGGAAPPAAPGATAASTCAPGSPWAACAPIRRPSPAPPAAAPSRRTPASPSTPPPSMPPPSTPPRGTPPSTRPHATPPPPTPPPPTPPPRMQAPPTRPPPTPGLAGTPASPPTPPRQRQHRRRRLPPGPGPWAPGLLVALLAAARLRKKRQNPANFA
ncbi:MAG: hypothetical protein R3F43_25115 [bacterium]